MLVALQHVLVSFCHVKIQPWEFEKQLWVGARWPEPRSCKTGALNVFEWTKLKYDISYVYVSMSYHLLSSWYVDMLIWFDMYWYVRHRKWQVRELESLVQQRHPQLAPQPQSAPPVRSPMGEAKFAVDDWKVKMWIINDYILVGVFFGMKSMMEWLYRVWRVLGVSHITVFDGLPNRTTGMPTLWRKTMVPIGQYSSLMCCRPMGGKMLVKVVFTMLIFWTWSLICMHMAALTPMHKRDRWFLHLA